MADRPGKKTRKLTATQVARNLSEVLNRVRYNQETVLVERGGVSVCEIRPVYDATRCTGADLAELLRALPSPGESFLDAVEDGIRNQPVAEETRWRR